MLNFLKLSFQSLTSTEQKIATVILQDPSQFITFTMNDLSNAAGVSHGSIINFAKKFSGGGFPSLKLQIAGNLSDYQQPFSTIQKEDSVLGALQKIIDDSLCAFQNTMQLNDEQTLQRVAARIMHAKKVELYGIFHSAVVATDFHYQLLQLGIPASFVSDILLCAVSASMLDSNCLIIAVSSSGKTRDIIDAVKIAKANNVPVVCLTSDSSSPLAHLSDDVLVSVGSGNSLGENYSEIRLSQSVLINAICAYLRSQIDEDGQKSYFGLQGILNSHNVND